MSTTTTQSSGSQSINDSMAGTKAQKYINSLYQSLQTATSNYNSQSTLLKKYTAQQTDYTTKYENAQALYGQLSNNLKDATSAAADVKQVIAFFSSQQSSVLGMVQNAKDMSTSAYESLAFLVQQGIGRVEAINTTINADNESFADKKNSDSPPPPNTPEPWISSVTDAVGKAQASGKAAMDAGQEAVEAAFNAYITNQTIYSRTTSYLNSFTSFYKELQSLLNRLVQETSLAKHQSSLLKAQLDIINERVKALTLLVDKRKISMDEATQKYNAAQQGASYAGTSAAAS